MYDYDVVKSSRSLSRLLMNLFKVISHCTFTIHKIHDTLTRIIKSACVLFRVFYGTATDAERWQRHHHQPAISQHVRFVSTCLRTRSHCPVSTPSVSNVFKNFVGACYRETEQGAPSVERNFRFHEKGSAVFSIILLCSSWWTRKKNAFNCEKVLAISTAMNS